MKKKEEEDRKAEEERLKKEEARRKKEAEEASRLKAEADRMADERDRKDRQQERRGPRFGGSTGGKYVPPSRRKAQQVGAGREERVNYPGGGRYDRDRQEEGGSRQPSRWR